MGEARDSGFAGARAVRALLSGPGGRWMPRPDRGMGALALLLVGAGAGPAVGGEADVLAARVVCGEADCRVEATLRHADTGFEHYADRFEVLAPDGSVLGVRYLLHPHVEEQPFTRSLEGVRIPAGVTRVLVRAHDSVHGTRGRVVEVPVPARPPAGGAGGWLPRRPAPAFERTEQRAPCARSEPLRIPLFGDLHVHTLYSFDSYVSSQRNDPAAAYRFARGEPLVLPDEEGRPTITVQLRRPLDFAAVTDHAEYLGPIELCTGSPWRPAYWRPHCVMSRSSHFWTQLLAARWWTELTGMGEADQLERSGACWLGDCEAAEARVWRRIQEAAEAAYDRSAACRFTTFIGYEYTDAPGGRNLHRNVIFRNERVPDRPVSTYDTGRDRVPRLWQLLRETCLEGKEGCDVLAIPHDPNLAGGLMFPDPDGEQEARDRLLFERLVELTQHKGSSECRYDRLRGRGLFTEDELCTFEQVVADNLAMLGTVHGEVRHERDPPHPALLRGRRASRGSLRGFRSRGPGGSTRSSHGRDAAGGRGHRPPALLRPRPPGPGRGRKARQRPRTGVGREGMGGRRGCSPRAGPRRRRPAGAGRRGSRDLSVAGARCRHALCGLEGPRLRSGGTGVLLPAGPREAGLPLEHPAVPGRGRGSLRQRVPAAGGGSHRAADAGGRPRSARVPVLPRAGR